MGRYLYKYGLCHALALLVCKLDMAVFPCFSFNSRYPIAMDRFSS